MVSLALILGFVLGLSKGSQAHASNFSTTVDLGYSKYKGVEGSDGVSYWRGIRYAAPPIGDLRFRAPRDPISTGKQVLSADKVS
jgi:acetylcholinesterase